MQVHGHSSRLSYLIYWQSEPCHSQADSAEASEAEALEDIPAVMDTEAKDLEADMEASLVMDLDLDMDRGQVTDQGKVMEDMASKINFSIKYFYNNDNIMCSIF